MSISEIFRLPEREKKAPEFIRGEYARLVIIYDTILKMNKWKGIKNEYIQG